MKKTYKILAALAVASVALGAFADAANVLVSFSTKADKYADGSPVRDGEWYALCWSANDVFGGLNLDCTPTAEGDLVIMKAPLAKNGRCPYTVFQIDSQSPNCKRSGVYSVVMLDTRNVQGKPAKALPTAVNAVAVVQDYKAGNATSGVTTDEAKEVAWAASAVEVETPASIKGFKVIDDAKVEIEIADMFPGVKYNVKMGETVDNLETYALEVPADVNTEGAKIIIDADKAKFFQLVREPLKK